MSKRVFDSSCGNALRVRMSAATFVEAAVVVDAQTKDEGSRHFDALIRRAAITIERVAGSEHRCRSGQRQDQ
jgi:uncharacterized protein with PIN domain